ncbi:hypothetical protein [Viridibacillus arvi]|uniref:hypothetical protein n=1 Tax=Viridibacillus arvi TaxID=263475 RepID=UPI003D068FF8
MKQTEKLNLKKPDLTDYVNVSDINENMDILDAAVGKLNEGSTEIDDLQTVDKTLAGAINELKNDLATHLEDPNLPTKAVQDEINSNVKIVKANVDNVKTNVDNVNANVSTVKNLIGTANPTVADETTIMNYLKKIHNTQLPTGGLKPITNNETVTMSTTTPYKVFEIKGMGFLRKASFAVIPNTTINGIVDIWIDGSKMFTFTHNNGPIGGPTVFGILDKSEVVENDMFVKVMCNNYASNNPNTPISYKYGTVVNSASSRYVNLAGMRIPFNQSLVIYTTAINTSLGISMDVKAEVY